MQHLMFVDLYLVTKEYSLWECVVTIPFRPQASLMSRPVAHIAVRTITRFSLSFAQNTLQLFYGNFDL